MPFRKQKTNYLKLIIVSLAVIIALFVALGIFASFRTPNARTLLNNNGGLISQNLVSFFEKNAPAEPQIRKTSPVLGEEKAPITIFEYTSFGCSYGAQIQSVLKKVLQAYPDKVKIVWKDWPMADAYAGADLAHQAARCAQDQGKFWPYHDLLWQNQNDFSSDNIQKLAARLKLNLADFQNCLKNDLVKKIISQDVDEANALAISGTPHFYINRQELLGLATFDDFKGIIEAELKRP